MLRQITNLKLGNTMRIIKLLSFRVFVPGAFLAAGYQLAERTENVVLYFTILWIFSSFALAFILASIKD